MINLPITYADIERASQRIAGVAYRTPVLTSSQVDQQTKAHVFFKCENLQRAGAFKFRGAYNTIASLNESEKSRGVVAFSSGNHAQAIALAGQLLNVSTTIIMPTDAPEIKLANTRKYGGKVILYDRHTEDREKIANKFVNELGLTLIPPYNHTQVIAGQGTTAKELIEEVGSLDYLFVCVGGGGLISGCAIAAKHLSPGCTVIGVEPEEGNDVQQFLRSGKVVKIPPPNTIADGARTQQVGELPSSILRALVKDIVTVSDDQLRAQMKFFAEQMKIVVEPTGCLAAAGVLNNLVGIAGARVGVIISGGNVDMKFFSDVLTETSAKEVANVIN
jgi:threonine dehydratase